MSEQHAPGPWRTDPCFGHQVVLDSDGDMVADCCITTTRKHRPEGINETHACLISALPELLSACEWALQSCHHPACPIPRGKGQTTIVRDDCTCHVKAARAAIEKTRRPRKHA